MINMKYLLLLVLSIAHVVSSVKTNHPLSTSIRVDFNQTSTSDNHVEASQNYVDHLNSNLNTINHERSMFQTNLDSIDSQQATSPPSTDILIIPTKPIRFMKLFTEFKFKGFGIRFAKSLIKWQSFGVGVRIPITANFPKYDKLVYLPRINSLVGCSYPLNVRWTVSISIPLRVALHTIYRCVNRASDHISTANFIHRIVNPLFTDSYQRIGVTIGIRYHMDGRFKYTIGPWIHYLPSTYTTERYVVPVLLLPPAVTLMILNIAYPFDVELSSSKSNFSTSNDNDTLIEVMQQDKLRSKSMKSTPRMSLMSRVVMKRKKKNKKDMKSRGSRRRGLWFWRKMLLEWTKEKTIAASCSLGWFRSQHDVFMGSNINFDISPFRPFKARIERFSKRIVAYLFGPDHEEVGIEQR